MLAAERKKDQAMINSVNRNLLYIFCVIVVFLDFGIAFSFGNFFVGLLDEYQRDRATTATVQSFLVGVTLSFGVVGGALITKLGLPLVTLLACILVPVGFSVSFFATRIQHLYISIGLVSGIGIAMGYVSAVVIVGRIFTSKNRGLFLAILSASSSLAGLAYPYFIDWLIEFYYINGAFLILGAIYSNTFPLFIICWVNRTSLYEVALPSKKMTTLETEKAENESHATSKHKRNFIFNSVHTLWEMMNTTYALLLFASAISVAGINGYSGLILDICKWKGFSSSQGLFTFVIFNISNTVSRLLPGILKRMEGINSFIYPICATISGCIGQLLLYFGKSYAVYIIGTSLSGIAIGGVVSAQLILVLQIVRPELIPVASGLLFTMTGVISAESGPIFGSLRDNSGNYGSVVLTVGSIQAIAAIFFIIALLYRRIDNAKKKKTHQTSDNSIFSIAITQD